MQKLLITLMFIMGVTMAQAAHEHEPETKTYDFFWSNIPAVCSSQQEIQRWADDKGFEPISMSYGRDNGQPDGEVRYIVVYWLYITIIVGSVLKVSPLRHASNPCGPFSLCASANCCVLGPP